MLHVASLWIGGALSALDRICLRSFVVQGHAVTLFHYFPLENVPEDITCVDAREVYDNDDILIHKNGSPAMHADIFRLHLLAKTDMAWVDTDMYCLRPFDNAPFLIPWEVENAVTNCVLRLPKDSAALSYMREFVTNPYPIPPWVRPAKRRELIAAAEMGKPVHVSQQLFTTLGPRLLKYALNQSGEIAHAVPPHVYLPLPSTKHRFAVKAKFRDVILNDLCQKDTKGVHMWSTNLRKNGWLDKIEEGSFLHGAAKALGEQI